MTPVENIDEYLPDLDIWKCHPIHPAKEFLNNPKGVVDNSNSSYLKEIENTTEWEQMCGSYNPQRISMQNSKNRFFFFTFYPLPSLVSFLTSKEQNSEKPYLGTASTPREGVTFLRYGNPVAPRTVLNQ